MEVKNDGAVNTIWVKLATLQLPPWILSNYIVYIIAKSYITKAILFAINFLLIFNHKVINSCHIFSDI